jgi:hypothetical protein
VVSADRLVICRPGSAGRRVDAGVGEDLPDGGGRDPVPESGELALDAAIPHQGFPWRGGIRAS